MNAHDIQTKYRHEIVKIAKECGALEISLFGSVAHGKQTEKSDVDFLVKMSKNSGFGIGGIQWRLEELLDCNVDIVSANALHPLIKEAALRDAIKL